MIVGIGIDVVEVVRIERIVTFPSKRSEKFLARCFTKSERAYCDARRDRASRYAARFAAKEAVMKALRAPRGLRWTDIEVSREKGVPTVVLSGAAKKAAKRLRAE